MFADVDAAKGLANWIALELDSRDLQGDWRGRLAGAFQSVSLDHHTGIISLFHERRNASAMALIRPQFEAHLRGLWILNSATDDEVDLFSQKGFLPNTEKLVERVEKKSLSMRVLKDQVWVHLCDYTHTGLRQINRNMTEFEIAQNYDSSELQAALHASNALALLAADEVALLVGDRSLRQRVQQVAVSWLRKKST